MNAHTLTADVIARAMGGEVSGRQARVPGPGHSAADRSLCIDVDPNAPGGFVTHSHAGDDPIACKDYVRERLNLPAWQPERPQDGPGARWWTAEYVYRREDGTPFLRVRRTPAKAFIQHSWNGSEWAKGKPKGPKLPYRLPDLLAAIHDTVFVCEGEKDADRLTKLGFVATCNSEGAGKWTDDLTPYLAGKVVYVLEDNDEAGRKHALDVARKVSKVAESVRIVCLPDLPEKGDVSDWLDAGGDPEQLLDLAASFPLFDETDTLPRDGLRAEAPGETAMADSRGYLIKGLLAPRDVACVFGAPGAGKSLFGPHLGYALSQGRPVFGMKAKPGARVLYVAAEDHSGMRQRMNALLAQHGQTDGFWLVSGVSDLVSPSSPNLAQLRDMIREKRADLVIIDTLAAAWPGLEENEASAMSKVVATAKKLTERGAAVLIVHHNAKDDSPLPRGHSVFNGALDVGIFLQRSPEGIIRGRLTKNRNGTCDRDIAFRIGVATLGTDEDGDPVTAAHAVELGEQAAPAPFKLSAAERAAMDVLQRMGGMLPGGCDEGDWRTACIESGKISAADDPQSRTRAMRRVVEGLTRKGEVTLAHGRAYGRERTITFTARGQADNPRTAGGQDADSPHSSAPTPEGSRWHGQSHEDEGRTGENVRDNSDRTKADSADKAELSAPCPRLSAPVPSDCRDIGRTTDGREADKSRTEENPSVFRGRTKADSKRTASGQSADSSSRKAEEGRTERGKPPLKGVSHLSSPDASISVPSSRPQTETNAYAAMKARGSLGIGRPVAGPSQGAGHAGARQPETSPGFRIVDGGPPPW